MSTLWDRPNGPVNPAAVSTTQPALNAQASQPGPLPVSQAITSTAETLIASALLSTVALTTQMQPDTALEQTIFNVIASGTIKTTGDGNLTLKLYSGNAISSGNLLKSSGAVAQNGGTPTVPVTQSFYIKGELMFDSVSGVLVGTVKFYLNRALVAEATLANFPGGFLNQGNPSANPPTLSNLPQFCMTLTSAAAGTGTPTTINVQKFNCG